MTKSVFECYSRLLVDNHISDCREEYMSRFSPEEYVKRVKESGVELSMVYACCHNGNCYYSTLVGHRHGGLKGRDIFGETVTLLRREGIVPVAYYTVNYHNDCAGRFPDSRLVDNRGETFRGRYHFTCPNQPRALAFYREQIREIMAYDIDGIFIDMTFWPDICFCDACREKFGRPFPEKIDWSDPDWVAFQRFRESSLAEFAASLTATAKACRPQAAVVHQFSPVLHGWLLGQSGRIAEVSDYASGDFYGGKLQQRFAVKAFDAFTGTPPFEFMTSLGVNLRDHTSKKSPDELLASALTTLANGGACLFIDAINPDGTLNGNVYKTLGEVNAKLAPFREAVKRGRFRPEAEIALYFSISCCVARGLDGTALADFDTGGANNMAVRQNDVLDEILGTAEILMQMHLPFRVVRDLRELDGFKAVIVNNASFLVADECARLREFVGNGGTLIATNLTSLQDMAGNCGGDFQLADVFGLDFSGVSPEGISYLGEENILAPGRAVLTKARPGTTVAATLTFPDFPYRDPEHYASIHSDPPGKKSNFPGLTHHVFGRGQCIYLASAALLPRQYTQREFGKRLFARYLPQFVTASRNLPGSAELTLLAGNDPGEHLLCLVNYQDELPPVPLRDVKITLRLPFAVRQVVRVADNTSVAFAQTPDGFTLDISVVEAGEFYLLKH